MCLPAVCDPSSWWVPPPEQQWRAIATSNVTYAYGSNVSFTCDGTLTPENAPTTYVLSCEGALGWLGTASLHKVSCNQINYVVVPVDVNTPAGFFEAAAECFRSTKMTLPWLQDDKDLDAIVGLIAEVSETVVPLANNVRRYVWTESMAHG
jgi:hypothetical protein